MNIDAIIDTQFSLRRLLRNKKHHKSKESIPKEDLAEEIEPEIRSIIKQIATQICKDPNYILIDSYTKNERTKDWQQLESKNPLENGEILPIDSRSRPGHKILDHYMNHFWDVTNFKGISVRSLFTQENLEKALLANVQNHSTPYRSEIRRMLIMMGGLGNVTKYKAITSKGIIQYFGAKRVLDPCIGWGGRMLGTLASSKDSIYVGFEPDSNTYNALSSILKDESIPENVRSRAIIFKEPAEKGFEKITHLEKFDAILTSPPYFNLELYTEGDQSTNNFSNWDDWVKNWLKPLIIRSITFLKSGGVSCWSVKNFKSDKVYPLADVTKQIHKDIGWELVKTVRVTGSGRMGGKRIKDGKESRESEEETFCFRKSI